MKLSENQINKIAADVFNSLNNNNSVELKKEREQTLKVIKATIKQNIQDEMALDNKVNLMMDELEKQNATEFERYKMFPLLKKKLAEQQGFVL